jgi:glycosyltransferase involved in cell wall biosynthesis
MRIAFVDNLPVGGGLSRFSYMLCKSLLEADRNIVIDYYAHHENIKRTPELSLLKERVTLKVLAKSLPPSFYGRAIKKISLLAGIKKLKVDAVIKEIEERVKGYDIAYFPSAHMMPLPSLSMPAVGTIHDFNWKYFFGRQIFSRDFVETMDVEIVKWMGTCKTVSSSFDVITEAKKLYPNMENYPTVVHIAPVVFSNDVEESTANKVLTSLNIDYPYLLFPGNFFPHKNHLNLFSGFSILRKRKGFEELKLILTGMGTDQVPYGIAERNGVQLKTTTDLQNFDVRGLGYQPNHVIDALIKKAKLIVSPSIYEAICTPGMDAWSFGTPTAISDIAPFREHEKVWGVKSAFFDPMSPPNIADVLENYLTNYSEALEDGRISKINMSKYSWKNVAEGYLNVFKEAISQKRI